MFNLLIPGLRDCVGHADVPFPADWYRRHSTWTGNKEQGEGELQTWESEEVCSVPSIMVR